MAATPTVERLPAYLRRYTTEQRGDRYTPADHAAWRYIMRQSRAYFRDHAVPIYLRGLERTGITRDRIPLIRDMDLRMQEIGWGAVPVEGFIPPAAFLDFQARRVLPIAFDMRSIDHIHYTPAPDIVHEAAGHAPILADAEYSEYVTMYANMAQKAIFAKHDLDLYEAIRTLSDVKENPDSAKDEIAAAERRLADATAACKFASEAAKVARMNWWTVEYGLLGSLKAPKIYGAGLLSSVGESQACLSDKVRKIRLTVDCVEQSYDITEPQPQLFVAEDIGHLCAVLKEYEDTLAFRRGGTYGLDEARKCHTVTTVVLGSGLEVSGVVDGYEATSDGTVEFVRFSGPAQLAVAGKELPGQGPAHHPHGFSSPLGRFRGAESQDPSRLDDAALERLGLVPGRRGELRFASGFVVRGEVCRFERAEGRLVVVKWRDCTVERGGKTYFEPAWGDFDMAVGEGVVSVFGGPADRERYGTHDVGNATTSPSRKSPYTEDEKAAFARYQEVREARARKAPADAQKLAERAAREMPGQWLLRLECLEILRQAASPEQAPFVKRYEAELLADAEKLGPDARWLVKQGVALAGEPD